MRRFLVGVFAFLYAALASQEIVVAEDGAKTCSVKEEKVKAVLESADKEDPAGMYEAGWFYYEGVCAKQDLPKAVELWTKAAGKGELRASVKAGEMLLYGHGVSRDPKVACDMFEIASKSGYSAGTAMLAACYQFGAGREKDLKKALSLYERSMADPARPSPMALVGKCMILPETDPGRKGEAAKLCEEAAAKGYPPAQLLMASRKKTDDVSAAADLLKKASGAGCSLAWKEFASVLSDASYKGASKTEAYRMAVMYAKRHPVDASAGEYAKKLGEPLTEEERKREESRADLSLKALEKDPCAWMEIGTKDK